VRVQVIEVARKIGNLFSVRQIHYSKSLNSAAGLFVLVAETFLTPAQEY
jgi:hypothetical protein